jgi:transcriptional regulator with XRE-family HTH domain
MKEVGNLLTLRELRVDLGWSMPKLAKEAGISSRTVFRAERGEKLSALNAKKIAAALSRGYAHEIKVSEIVGLNVQ